MILPFPLTLTLCTLRPAAAAKTKGGPQLARVAATITLEATGQVQPSTVLRPGPAGIRPNRPTLSALRFLLEARDSAQLQFEATPFVG